MIYNWQNWWVLLDIIHKLYPMWERKNQTQKQYIKWLFEIITSECYLHTKG